MERFPVELLIYGALFLGILLFNAMRAASRRQQPQPQQEAPEYSEYDAPPAEQPSDRYESADEFWGVRPATVTTSLAAAPVDRVERPRPPEPAAPRRERYTRRSLLGSKRDLRRAIVLMTVLGPYGGRER